MKLSTLLVGKERLKDSDSDGVPNIFDCAPFNKNKDSVMIKISEGREGSKFKEYSEQEVSQAESLIARNKTYAAAGDPRMQTLINSLITYYGGKSIMPEQIEQRKQMAEIKQAEELAKQGYQGTTEYNPKTGEVEVSIEQKYLPTTTKEGIKLEPIPAKSKIIPEQEANPLLPPVTPLTPYLKEEKKITLPKYVKQELPYQKRGTVSTETQPALVLDFGEPEPFISFTKKAITKSADIIREIPTKEYYTENYLFTPQPSRTNVYRKETITYEQPTLPKYKDIEKKAIQKEEQEVFKLKVKLENTESLEEQNKLIEQYE